jgi:hypothetical protein
VFFPLSLDSSFRWNDKVLFPLSLDSSFRWNDKNILSSFSGFQLSLE